MPGWGEDVNIRRYLRTVISFLLSRRAKDFEALGGGGCSPTARKVESSSSSNLKHSITACLYFLPPHRMKPIDVVIMSAVSKLVRARNLYAYDKRDAGGQAGTFGVCLLPAHYYNLCIINTWMRGGSLTEKQAGMADSKLRPQAQVCTRKLTRSLLCPLLFPCCLPACGNNHTGGRHSCDRQV